MTETAPAPLAARQRAVDRALAHLTEGAPATRLEPPSLLPAGPLLDLYGEDIRARAYLVTEPDGERMLRPDFTLPVVETHLAAGGGAARYVYAGPVWRRQAAGSARAREYVQVGLEIFGGDPAAAEAEVFARFQRLVAPAFGGQASRAEIGDAGLLSAAIDALETTPSRRAALLRHRWRPARFQRLLERFGAGHAAFIAEKAPLIEAWQAGKLSAEMAAAGAAVGLRDGAEIEARLARLAEEAESPPLALEGVARISALLSLEAPAEAAAAELTRHVAGVPALERAVTRFEARLQAIEAAGATLAGVTFRGAFGRTTLEYYDGFVFGFLAPKGQNLPVLASGGRFDALVRAMGGPESLSAVGGIVRPEALLALSEDAR